MKILHISSAKTYGDCERHLADLCRGLMERGHEIFVALRPTNEWQDKLSFLPPENIFHSSIRNSFGIFSARRIARFMSEKNIEIIHAHAARDYIPASLVCRLANNTKFVLTHHVPFPMKPFHRFTLTNLSRAIAVSAAVEKNLQAVLSKRKIEVIPNGIGSENPTGEERNRKRADFRLLHNIPPDAPVIGTIGELEELKGQRDFVLAAVEIARHNERAFFVIVGKDNSNGQQFRRELKRLVKIFNLESRFLWLDWVEDSPNFSAALDIFVSASHSESRDSGIFEAMTNKTPVVATETIDAKELLKNNETALLVPVKNPVKLAEAIENLLENAALREAFADRAQVFVRENFSLEKMIERTEDLYREILRS